MTVQLYYINLNSIKILNYTNCYYPNFNKLNHYEFKCYVIFSN